MPDWPSGCTPATQLSYRAYGFSPNSVRAPTNDVRALKSLAQTTEILEILETLNKCKAQIESVVSGITKNSLNKSSIDLLSESMKEFVSKRAIIKQRLNKHYVKK